MFFSADIVNLALFCAQQFGVALGVGAQTVMAIAYFQARRDGMVDDKEAQFLRATRRVLFAALLTIVVSGAAITALHMLSGNILIVFTPTYLFKWLLILAVFALTASAGTVPKNIFEMLMAANWYALFLVHTLAPVASWLNLLEWWAVWQVGFALCWYAFSYMGQHHHLTLPQIKVPGVPGHVLEKQNKQKAESKAKALIAPPVPVVSPSSPAEKPITKIVLEEHPVIQLPHELQKPPENPLIKPIVPPQPLTIQPTDIPMPAQKTTDTPFLPKVPPLQPIPTPVADQTTKPAELPKAPDAAPTLQKPEDLPKTGPATPFAINVMPKSPDQVKNS